MVFRLWYQRFGSENVFKIEYINVKKFKGVEILHSIITYQGNVYTKYKNYFQDGLIFKDKPSKHANFENGESAPPEKWDLVQKMLFPKFFA